MTKLLTVDQLANAAGVTVRTIRYYSSRGILSPVRVPGNGNRTFYPSESVQRLLALRSASLTLEDKVDAQVVEYHVAGSHAASDLIDAALMDGSLVMSLKDGTVVIRKPLPDELYDKEEQDEDSN